MAKYKQQTSLETVKQAEQVAKATQKPGQSKEQTKLIAQGIQKGIEQYKKQQKSKARTLDKKLKNIQVNAKNTVDELADNQPAKPSSSLTKLSIVLPWILLIGSWGYFLSK